jgi:hypothetical protein
MPLTLIGIIVASLLIAGIAGIVIAMTAKGRSDS